MSDRGGQARVGFRRPECQGAYCDAESAVHCCRHDRDYCAACAREHHDGATCYWAQSAPLALRTTRQLALPLLSSGSEI